MTGFWRTAGGVAARFSPVEAGILRTLVSQIAELVAGDPGVPGQAEDARAAGAGALGDQTPAGPDELAELLGELRGPTTPPADPVLARLLPDAYTGDPEAAGEFRRYTEGELREAKAENARLVLATLPEGGGRVRLSGDEAQAWLRAINDVRLALGVRLEVTEDFEDQLARMPADDPRAGYFQVYDWLTEVQETLVRALW